MRVSQPRGPGRKRKFVWLGVREGHALTRLLMDALDHWTEASVQAECIKGLMALGVGNEGGLGQLGVGAQGTVQLVEGGHHALNLDQAFEGSVTVAAVQKLDSNVEQRSDLVLFEFADGRGHGQISSASICSRRRGMLTMRWRPILWVGM